MNAFSIFRDRVEEKLLGTYPELSRYKDLLGKFTVDPPRDKSHGDLSCNAAMVFARALKSNPREIARALADAFVADEQIEKSEVAGPGFVNFTLSNEFWLSVLADANRQGEDFGRPTVAPEGRVNVEYVSANPTGPLHLGHTRGAVFGDALARLMAFCRYDITREYYINDAGGQIAVLVESACLRYREALGEDIGEIPGGLYPGQYLVAVGHALKDKFGNKLCDMDAHARHELVRPVVLELMLEIIRDDLASLDIRHDVFFSESLLHDNATDGNIKETLNWLGDRDLVYRGQLDKPKGKPLEDWEDREQLLFRATKFDDDTDRALVKSDGSYTYFAADIAYHRNKFLRGYNTQIVVVGADHAGYVKRLAAAGRAVSLDAATVDVRICQLVNLLRDGKPAKMSKRAGTFVTMRQLVDEVGPDVVRFIMLFRRNEAPLDFDFDLVTQQTRENPVFYVQYAHARACSVFRNVRRDLPDLDISGEAIRNADLSPLVDPAEIELIKTVALFPRLIQAASSAHEPHRIAFYVHELAAAFHAFWTRGKQDPELRFVNHENIKITLARLALVNAVRQVLRTALSILGVTAPEELS